MYFNNSSFFYSKLTLSNVLSDIRSLSTERLAASIVEQVLGPALTITSNAGSLLPASPATSSQATPTSNSNLVSSDINIAEGILKHLNFACGMYFIL